MSRFMDKVIIITGAAGGIGKEVARRLASEGAKLTLVDVNEEAIENMVSELQLQEDNILVVKADVSKEQDVKTMLKKRLKNLAKLTVSQITQALKDRQSRLRK